MKWPLLTNGGANLRRFLTQPALREFLLWCLPALAVGLGVRGVLLAQLPYGIYHADTGDLLSTPFHYFKQHQWLIHGKKTFLVPVVYTWLAILKVPLLLAVPVIQHLLGVLMIVMTGLLCRLWLARWRWFILPVTLLAALHPALLWYEHFLMAETPYVFCLVLLSVAGTLYSLEQTWGRFALLCVSLVLLAGSRPEGKLLFGFAFFLYLLLHWRQWRDWQMAWPRLVILALVALGTNMATPSGQAGLLLYTSVSRFTPRDLQAAPGFEPYIAKIRQDIQDRWDTQMTFPQTGDRRLIGDAVEDYLKTHTPKQKAKRGKHRVLRGHDAANDLCLKMAMETCRRNLLQLPWYAYQKFRFALKEPSYGFFDRHWVIDRQQMAFSQTSSIAIYLTRSLTGQVLHNEASYASFLHAHYREVAWFDRLAVFWNEAVNLIRPPDEERVTASGRWVRAQPPVLYLMAGAGVVLTMFRRGALQPFHVSWGLAQLGLFFVVMLTANLRGRFRFGWEPFWFIYAALVFDLGLNWVLAKRRISTEPSLLNPVPAHSL